MQKKVLVAMSGGIDSSVAALLLAEQGYSVTGVTLCFGIDPESKDKSCCSVADAKRVCLQLGIPHFVLDFYSVMEDQVIRPFIDEYLAGRTPNPCVICNQQLKFGRLLDYAHALGFEYLATGHYAKTMCINGEYRLMKPVDIQKDQTYFLYSIGKDALASTIFPLADLRKHEVRTLAERAEIPVLEKPESQDACFIPREGLAGFFKERGIQIPGGDIISDSGEILGIHRGVPFYTVGQRRGLGISARNPFYVTALDPATRRIVVGSRGDLLADGLIADTVTLLVKQLPEKGFAKIRHAHKASPCSFSLDGDILRVTFNEPQEAVTPGQSVVLYDGDTVLGGGVIRESIK